MKRYLIPAIVAVVVFFALTLLRMPPHGCNPPHECGSSQEKPAWFPVEGGYVNLSNITVVRSTGRLVLSTTRNVEQKDILGRARVVPEKTVVAKLLDGPITEASIAAAKGILSEASGWSTAEGGAQLQLDDVSVPFAPIPPKADAAALAALLDEWLRQTRVVDAALK